MLTSGKRPWLRRLLLPLTLAIGCIATLETVTALTLRPDFWDRTLWLLHDPNRGEPFDRMVVYTKLSILENSNPDIISVGDSSGFFSLQPNIVSAYLDGKTYVNLSTGANQAFDGYYGIAEYMLRRSPNLKHVVLYMHPQLLPSDAVLAQADLGGIVRRNLVGPYRGLLPPSAALSQFAKAAAFEHRIVRPGEPMLNHKVALEFAAIAQQSRGWEPEHDIRFNRANQRTPSYPDIRSAWYARLGLAEQSAIIATLTEFARMVESYGASLVIIFAPMADTSVFDDPNMAVAQARLDTFSRSHPSVKFLTPLVEVFGAEKFGMWNHISREYSNLSSQRVGLALRSYLRRADKPWLFRTVTVQQYPGLVRVGPATEPDPPDSSEARAAALALYHYAATADEKYVQLMSRRVIDALEREDSFALMLHETRERIRVLAARGASTSIDDSNIVVEPVRVENFRYCGDGQPVWVQLSGVMKFRYTELPRLDTVEPVAWPETSHILIPLVREDGRLKFDGYCPEPTAHVMR